MVATRVAAPTGPGPNDEGLSRSHILDAVDASLRRLGVEHIDLYQIHRWDPHVPIDETMEALHDVVRAGKVRYLGASRTRAWQFAKAEHVADLQGWARFVAMQNHYNLLYRGEEREMNSLLLDQGVACLPWSPLARGRLGRAGHERTGTTRAASDGWAEELYRTASEEVLARTAQVAAEREVPPAQVTLAWLLHQPVVTAPIVGATKHGQLEDAAAATELALPDEGSHGSGSRTAHSPSRAAADGPGCWTAQR